LPSVESRLSFDASGIDHVEFLVSPNPGEGLKPMIKIASGGETARLMLALKTVLSRADETSTLIFDEIDQGIGGRVGATVGFKLYKLTVARLGSPQVAQLDAPQVAQLDAPQAVRPGSPQVADGDAIEHQVLCVTHLPQLAGYGDRHFKVEKQVIPSTDPERGEQRTVTGVRRLEGDARVEELAQMLGLVSDSTRESARAILARVQESKAVQSSEG
jgi:DNA repair protein RecN (Recombination protein N)